MNSEHRIQLVDLTKRFGSFVAVDNVSLDYSGSRAVGYLGPNGAGKTTTMKVLTTLFRPSSGQALIDGIDVTHFPKKAMAQVGALVESPQPYPQLKAIEALMMVGEFRGMRGDEIRSRVRELTDLLELPPLERKVGKLSKGQRQRVVFAGTILADPPVVILDEPTSGLDPAERVRIRNVILELKKDHLVLMSSHLLSEVTETCDNVIFLNHGKILLEDTVENIDERTRPRFVEVTFASPVRPEAFAPFGPLVNQVEPMSDRKFRLSFDGIDSTRARLLMECMGLAPVLEYSSPGSALEETYMQLMVETPLGPPPPPAVPPPS